MITLTLLLFLCALTLFVLVHRYAYWKRKGVLQYQFWQIWYRNVMDFIKQPPLTEAMVKMYNDFYDARYIGTYQLFVPRLCIKDPELIKKILVKDFDYFVDHNMFIPTDGDSIWEKSLFTLKGKAWRHMRSIATPTFTSSKMKIMFNTMVDCSKELLRTLDHQSKETVTLEMKELFGRLTSDIYFATHFGIFCNSLKDVNNEFYLMGKLGADFEGLWIKIRFILIQMCPQITKIFGLKVFDQKVNAFFRRLVHNNIKVRKLHEIVRPDFINMLMESKHNEDDSSTKLTEEDVVAIALTFFGGGFDSVSTLLAFVMYELAHNPQVQQSLQNEIDSSEKNLTYNSLFKMKYLDMVVTETLRKWPGGFFLERRCVRPYTISPLKNGEVEIKLNKGDQIWIPLFALQRDSYWYNDPNQFNPDRFDSKTNKSVNPCTYMPFGMGPRHCVGNRYALLVTKVVVYHFLSKYNVKVVKKTVTPIRLARTYFQLVSKDKFWLGYQKRN